MPATTASATREQLWIEPTGVVHSFDDEKHGQWAMKHLGLSYYQPLQEGEDGFTKEIPENWKDDLDVEEDAQDQLLKAGWVRMGFFRRSRWAVVYLQKDTPLTQAELAKALEMSQGNVAFYERGQTVPPHVAPPLLPQ